MDDTTEMCEALHAIADCLTRLVFASAVILEVVATEMAANPEDGDLVKITALRRAVGILRGEHA